MSLRLNEPNPEHYASENDTTPAHLRSIRSQRVSRTTRSQRVSRTTRSQRVSRTTRSQRVSSLHLRSASQKHKFTARFRSTQSQRISYTIAKRIQLHNHSASHQCNIQVRLKSTHSQCVFNFKLRRVCRADTRSVSENDTIAALSKTHTRSASHEHSLVKRSKKIHSQLVLSVHSRSALKSTHSQCVSLVSTCSSSQTGKLVARTRDINVNNHAPQVNDCVFAIVFEKLQVDVNQGMYVLCAHKCGQKVAAIFSCIRDLLFSCV